MIAIDVGMISRPIHLVLIQQFSLHHLEPCFSHRKRSMPLSFINVDISQRLQAISLPFTDCALNEATMNGCIFCLFPFHLALNGDGVEDYIQCLSP